MNEPSRRRLRIGDPADPATWGDAVAASAAALARGEVVLLPAEGLYGYHVRGDLPQARAALERLKPSEARRGWILLVADPAQLLDRGVSLSETEAALVAVYWPGALTLVLATPGAVPPALLAVDGSVAVRCPGSPFLRRVVSKAGGWVISTSANRPGGRPPAIIDEAAAEDVLLVVDAGPLSGQPSTVVRVDGSTVRVLRSGAVRIGPSPLDASGTPP